MARSQHPTITRHPRVFFKDTRSLETKSFSCVLSRKRSEDPPPPPPAPQHLCCSQTKRQGRPVVQEARRFSRDGWGAGVPPFSSHEAAFPSSALYSTPSSPSSGCPSSSCPLLVSPLLLHTYTGRLLIDFLHLLWVGVCVFWESLLNNTSRADLLAPSPLCLQVNVCAARKETRNSTEEAFMSMCSTFWIFGPFYRLHCRSVCVNRKLARRQTLKINASLFGLLQQLCRLLNRWKWSTAGNTCV